MVATLLSVIVFLGALGVYLVCRCLEHLDEIDTLRTRIKKYESDLYSVYKIADQHIRRL